MSRYQERKFEAIFYDSNVEVKKSFERMARRTGEDIAVVDCPWGVEYAARQFCKWQREVRVVINDVIELADLLEIFEQIGIPAHNILIWWSFLSDVQEKDLRNKGYQLVPKRGVNAGDVLEFISLNNQDYKYLSNLPNTSNAKENAA